jgi:hypothetical protein
MRSTKGRFSLPVPWTVWDDGRRRRPLCADNTMLGVACGRVLQRVRGRLYR